MADYRTYIERNTKDKGSDGIAPAVTYRKMTVFPFGTKEVEDYLNYGTPEQRVALTEYFTGISDYGYKKVKFKTTFDGGWRRYTYDSAGRVIKEVAPFGDAPPEAAENLCVVTTYSYARLLITEVLRQDDDRWRTKIVKTLGSETAREYRLYFSTEEREITASAPGAAYSAVGNQVRKTFYDSTSAKTRRVIRVEESDGTFSATTYTTNSTTGETTATTNHGFQSTVLRTEIVVTDKYKYEVSRKVTDAASGLAIEGYTNINDDFGRSFRRTTLDGDVTLYGYDMNGLLKKTAPDGSVTNYVHDLFGRLKEEKHAGIVTKYTYDANDNIVKRQVHGKNSHILENSGSYTGDGQALNAADASGATTLYRQGTAWKEEQDALGGIRRTEYYRDGSVKSVSGSAAIPKTYEYGVENGELYALERASATEWVKSYTDFLGRRYKTVYPDGFAETTHYDALGRVRLTENSEGLKVFHLYEETTGKYLAQVTPRHETDSATLYTNAQILAFPDAKTIGFKDIYEMGGIAGMVMHTVGNYITIGGQVVETYVTGDSRDGKNRWIVDKGVVTHHSITYLGSGQVRETFSESGGIKTLTNTYANGILTQSTDNATGTTTYQYDEFNRLTGTEHKENGVMNIMRYSLDPMGRTLSATQSAGGESRSVSYIYDALGRKTSETSAEGVATTYSYTQRGELAEVSGGNVGGVGLQWYTYDAQGRMTTLETLQDSFLQQRQETAFAYDNRGRLTRKTYADDSHEDWTYRGDGKIATHTNVRGQTRTYSYNLAGETLSDGVRSYTYDRNGRIASVTGFDRSGAPADITFTYDAYGRLLSETLPHLNGAAAGLTTGRNYDAYGRKSAVWVGNYFRADYGYDAQGRLNIIGNGTAYVTHTYQPGTSRIGSSVWKNIYGQPFMTHQHTYDQFGRTLSTGVNNVVQASYTYDDDDRRTMAAINGENWSYRYNRQGRLEGAASSQHWNNYQGDGAGNRYILIGDEVLVNTINELNQYTSVNIHSGGNIVTKYMTYDADGNMLTNGDGWTYTWDIENRLTKAEKGSVRLEFAYDYMARRVWKRVYANNVITKYEKYVYDGFKLIAIYNGLANDQWQTGITWQPSETGAQDVPLSLHYAGTQFYYATDANKNILSLHDNTGAQAMSYTYDPFGNILSQSGLHATGNPFRFSSEFHDEETGLVYYNFRYYDPKLGRWLSRDPIGEEGGVNLYGFVGNDPVNNWDELGLIWQAARNFGIIEALKISYPIWHPLMCEALYRIGAQNMGTPEERRAWDRFTGRNGRGDIELTSEEVRGIANNSTAFRNRLEAIKMECQLGVASSGTLTVGIETRAPWTLALGGVALQVSYQCTPCCLWYDLAINDLYDFDILGIPGLTRRTPRGELATIAVRVAQVAGQCGWREFFHKGEYHGHEKSC